MAITPTKSETGPIKELNGMMKGNTKAALQKRLRPGAEVEQQRVRQKPSRRSQQKAAIERSQARKDRMKRGNKLDVRA